MHTPLTNIFIAIGEDVHQLGEQDPRIVACDQSGKFLGFYYSEEAAAKDLPYHNLTYMRCSEL